MIFLYGGLTLLVRGSSLDGRIRRLKRQILTSKVDPRTERVKYDNICIQMKQKELTKTFMMISIKTLWSPRFITLFQRCKGSGLRQHSVKVAQLPCIKKPHNQIVHVWSGCRVYKAT